MSRLSAYLPQDRLRALAQGINLPDRTQGAALFADISGFTPLTEALMQQHGSRRGVDELTCQVNAVYDVLIAEVERQGGSVISFAGDALTCWFEDLTPRPPSLQGRGGGAEQGVRAVRAAFKTIQAVAEELREQ